jgi:hypothetical protein
MQRSNGAGNVDWRTRTELKADELSSRFAPLVQKHLQGAWTNYAGKESSSEDSQTDSLHRRNQMVKNAPSDWV